MMGGSRSRSRSPSRRGGGGGMDRRRSRSRSPRDRDRDRRYRPDRERRSRSPPRHRPRSPPRRNMRSRSRSRSRERKDFNRDKPTTSRPPMDESELEGKTEEEIEMMRIMGFSQFDTTKGKPVTGANASSVNIIHKRKYRQYMNRKGGFNRPLDFVA